MTRAADAATIEGRFQTEWTTLYPDMPKFFQGQQGTGPDDETWVRLTILPGGPADQVEMGMNRRFRSQGIVVLQIFVPIGEGEGQAQDIGDSFATVFQGRTVNGVIFRGAGLGRIGTDGAWVQYNATVPYQSDDIVSI